MPNNAKRQERISSDDTRRESISVEKRATRRSARIVPLMAAILCALAVIVSGCGGGGQPKSDDANKTQATSSDQASEEAKKKEEAEKAAAEKAAAEKAAAEKLEAEHKALRDEAVANGEQVFEGTIYLGNGVEVANMLGTTAELNGNGPSYKEYQEKITYAMLALDSPQPVYITSYSNGPVTRDYAYINLGANNSKNNGFSDWEQYRGKRVCIAVNKCGLAEDVNIMSQPTAGESRLLYVVDDSTASPADKTDAQASTTSAQPAAQSATSEKDKAITDARNSGYRVAGGTVQVMGLLDYCKLIGYSTESPDVQYYGNSLRAAVLSLDDDSKAELGYDHLVLGSEVGIGGPVDPWSQYNGKHVVVRASSIGRSGGEISDNALTNPEVIYEG